MLCTGWAREGGRKKGGEGAAREREHCSAYSPPLALKQQQEEREKESGREGGREPQVRKRRGEQQSASAAGGEKWSFEIASALIHPFLSFLFSSPLVLAQPRFLSPPAFDCSVEFWQCLVSVILLFTRHSPSFVWRFAWVGSLFFLCECVATDRDVDPACRGCFIETVYAALPLSAVCTPDVPSSSFSVPLSISDSAREVALLSTHILYSILGTIRILTHYSVSAFNSQRTFIQSSPFIVWDHLYILHQRW